MLTPLRPGCYFDSHRGHYIYPEIIRFARSFGRPTDEEIETALARYDGHYHEADYPHEAIIEESEAAIEWLNEHFGQAGHVWEWNDGDFGLYAVEEEE